jgi:hypothetical protein
MRRPTAQATREFLPPHAPRELGPGPSDGILYRYRGFEFEVRPGGRLLGIWPRYFCGGYHFPDCGTEMAYSRGSIPGVVSGSLDRVLGRLRRDIDRRIDEDIARQIAGQDTHFETVEQWFARHPDPRADRK